MADDDPEYLDFVRGLPCCVCFERAPSEAHHAPGAGMGLRSPDRTAVPLCTQCHRDFHSHRGRFLKMNRAEKRDWQSSEIERCLAEWEMVKCR